MSDSMSCVSCDFLQVQNFNSSSTPSSLSNGISEDEEHDGSPNPRYILRCFSKVRLWGCKIYYVISSNILHGLILIHDALWSVLLEPIFHHLFIFICRISSSAHFFMKKMNPSISQFCSGPILCPRLGGMISSSYSYLDPFCYDCHLSAQLLLSCWADRPL